MEWDLQQIFRIPPITPVTINTVSLSPSFREIVYFTIVTFFILGTIFFSFSKKNRLFTAMKKASVSAFFAAGLLYACYADFGWTAWLADDARAFSGLDTDAKLSRIDGWVADFSREVKKVLRPEYMLFSSTDFYALRTEYFLLPLRKRELADDIVVLDDFQSRYDLLTRTFTRGDLKIEQVDPVFMGNGVYVLRKRK